MLRMLLGAVILIAGGLELILGIGHRRVIALGGLLPAGGATAARARPGHHSDVDEPQPTLRTNHARTHTPSHRVSKALWFGDSHPMLG